MGQRLGKAAIDMLSATMRAEDDPQASTSTFAKPTRSSSDTKGEQSPKVQLPQLYGFVEPELKDAMVAKAKEHRIVTTNVLVEGLYAWVSDTEWTPRIQEWVREHMIAIIRNRIVKSEVLTARVGGPAPLELHANLKQACAGTSITVQNLIYVVVSHFVSDDEFAAYITEQAVNRKIAALDAQMGD